jgi:hypothetical protein
MSFIQLAANRFDIGAPSTKISSFLLIAGSKNEATNGVASG